MPIAPRPLPPDLADAFTCRAALAAGATPRRLRARDLETPFRGVRLRPPSSAEIEDAGPLALDRAVRADVLRRAGAYALLMPPAAFFVGATAGVILGLGVPHGPKLCVGVPPPHRAPRRTGIHGVKLAPSQARIIERDGLRLTDTASTWATLAGRLGERDLVRVGDAAVRVPRDDRGRHRTEARLATIDDLRAAALVPGRRHRAALLRALDRVRVGSMSPLETDFRLDAEDAGLPEPELDVAIRTESGRLLGISDLVYPGYRTVVEVEGDHHRTMRQQWNRDIEKYAAYAAQGWEVVRLTSTHIRGWQPQAVALVRAALLRRGWRPPAQATPERGRSAPHPGAGGGTN